MPIVGIEIFSVISFEVLGEIHSNTIEKAPAFSINKASFKSFLALKNVSPSILNFFLNCGVKPICPITGILCLTKNLIIL